MPNYLCVTTGHSRWEKRKYRRDIKKKVKEEEKQRSRFPPISPSIPWIKRKKKRGRPRGDASTEGGGERGSDDRPDFLFNVRKVGKKGGRGKSSL